MAGENDAAEIDTVSEPNERKGTVIGIFRLINRFDSPTASIQTV
jgi:hypothetical protein